MPKDDSTPPMRAEMKIAERVFDEWGLGKDARIALSGVLPDVYEKMLTGGEVPKSVFERHVLILNIWTLLNVILQNNSAAAKLWVTTQNQAPTFGGQPPLALMCTGPAGLSATKEYVERHAYVGW